MTYTYKSIDLKAFESHSHLILNRFAAENLVCVCVKKISVFLIILPLVHPLKRVVKIIESFEYCG